MLKFLETLISLVLFSLVLFACSPGATPLTPTQVSAASQVLIQGNTLAEETQTIELDNCDGKADAVRSEQRGQSVDVTVSAEVAAKLGVSVEVIQAEVQATVGAQVTDSGYRSSTIQLVAPPKTRMVFQIVWTGPEQVGIVQNLKSVGVPIAFRRFSPTDVKIKGQLDIGCPGNATSNNNSQSSTQNPQPTSALVTAPTQIPTRRNSCKYGVVGQGQRQVTATCPGVCALYFYPFGGVEKTFVFRSDSSVTVQDYNGTLACWQVQPSWYDVNGAGPEPSHPYANIEEVTQAGVSFSDNIVPIDPNTLQK